MRVMVVKPKGGAFVYITKGFINAFRDIGVECKYWDGKANSFEIFKPNLYIGCSGHRQEIPARLRKGVKVAIHVNPYTDRKLPKIFGVDINESQNAIDWTVSQNPNIVFGYGLNDDEKVYWPNYRKNHNVPFVGCPCAGDIIEYFPDPGIDQSYDIAYLGGRWAYKAHKIDEWLVPICKKENHAIVKGWGDWSLIDCHDGKLPDGMSGRRFLSSAKVGPCISEPHTSEFGFDIPERFFKVALCGVLPVIDYVPGFNRYYPEDCFVMGKTPQEYQELVIDYAFSHDLEDDRINRIYSLMLHTIKKHTYHVRMENICRALGFNDIADRFSRKTDEYIKKYNQAF